MSAPNETCKPNLVYHVQGPTTSQAFSKLFRQLADLLDANLLIYNDGGLTVHREDDLQVIQGRISFRNAP